MSKSRRRSLKRSELVFTVGSLLASLGMSLGVIPGPVQAETATIPASPATPESTANATTGQTNLTTADQQAEYQREALLRGDGSQSVSAYSKTGKILADGPWAAGLSPAEKLDESARRSALINQGMTLADLEKADAALQAEAGKRAPAGDTTAQAQILLELKQNRIMDYNVSASASAQIDVPGSPVAIRPSTPYDLVLHDLMPNAALGKTKIDPDMDLEIQKRVDMLKSGMSYQQVVDTEKALDAALMAQAATAAPNDQAAQAQIYQQLNHEQLVQDLWQLTQGADRYAMILAVVQAEYKDAKPPLTPLQMETEAIKRMTLLNSGLNYPQVMAVAEADRQAMLAAAAAAAVAATQQQNQSSSSAQTSSSTTVASGTGGGATGTAPTGSRIYICN